MDGDASWWDGWRWVWYGYGVCMTGLCGYGVSCGFWYGVWIVSWRGVENLPMIRREVLIRVRCCIKCSVMGILPRLCLSSFFQCLYTATLLSISSLNTFGMAFESAVGLSMDTLQTLVVVWQGFHTKRVKNVTRMYLASFLACKNGWC